MKKFLSVQRQTFLALLAAALWWPACLSQAENINDLIKSARGEYAADRQKFVGENLQLTESESAAFWPLYREYRAKTEKLGDGLVKLVLEYADAYPDVPEERARQLLKDYTALEKKLADQRASYLKKFARVISAAKTLRFAQLENRLDLELRLQMASALPLTPIEGRLTGSAAMASATAQGVPGGIAVRTFELTATVAAIDQAARKLTLVSPDGIKQTVKVGPEAVNFDQIRLGDRLNVTVAEELVVSVADEGETPSDTAAGFVALAPEGAKPGAIVAETTQVTAKVTALDRESRKATLQFEDGSVRTVAVRPDVDLSKRKVGDLVVIRMTEAVAITVKQP